VASNFENWSPFISFKIESKGGVKMKLLNKKLFFSQQFVLIFWEIVVVMNHLKETINLLNYLSQQQENITHTTTLSEAPCCLAELPQVKLPSLLVETLQQE
jgi:hypothetical protein